MKVFLLVIFFLLVPIKAQAEEYFDDTLDILIDEYGVFDGKQGVIYAQLADFYYEHEFLLVCRAGENSVIASVYTKNDGIECVDSISFSTKEDFKLSLAEHEGCAYLLKNDTYFALMDDSFTKVPKLTSDKKSFIVRTKKGKLVEVKKSPQDIFNLRNDIRLQRINKITLTDCLNTIPEDVLIKIRELIIASCDLTSFNINDYDYDLVFKYLLFTHKKFSTLFDIPPHTNDEGDIKSVSAEYIDFIMINILNIPPIHPEFTELTERGFCYRDGQYLYRGGFYGSYDTKILDFIKAYELKEGIYYILFSDVYTDGELKIPEYSFLIVDTNYDIYKLLRLGMGESPLNERELKNYFETENENETVTENKYEKEAFNIKALIPFIVLVTVTIVFIIIKRKTDKH